MKKLLLLLLLVICSNFITKAWCVLCVREHSALELLKQEDAHHIVMETTTYDHDRTMTRTYNNLEKNTVHHFYHWYDTEGHFSYKIDQETTNPAYWYDAFEKSTETEANHQVICDMNENRTMTEEVTVTNIDNKTSLTLQTNYTYNFATKKEDGEKVYKISGVNVSLEDFANARSKSKKA